MDKKIKKNIRAGIILTSIFIAITVLSYALHEHLNPFWKLDTNKLGHFGDFIGGFLGVILTAIATVLIYLTYTSQKEELNNQKKLIQNQQFETTFFNMLNVHRQLKQDLKDDSLLEEFSINRIETELNGVETFRRIIFAYKILYDRIIHNKYPVSEMFNQYKEKKIKEYYGKYSNIPAEDKTLTSQSNFVYKIIFEKFQHILSHYCRNVYQILKFIRENEERDSDENKEVKYKKYADILQSQLNVDEQFILFYNFIYFDTNDNEEYLHPIEIVNHYKFLENIGIQNLIKEEHKEFYNFPIKGSGII